MTERRQTPVPARSLTAHQPPYTRAFAHLFRRKPPTERPNRLNEPSERMIYVHPVHP
jgi:hypothetical protein